MTTRPRLLFVSNGVGEDLIAAEIIRHLTAAGAAVTAYPLVGLGAYPPEVPLLDPRRELPSGGFSMRAGNRGLAADLACGMIGLWFAQRRTLWQQRHRWDLVVAVGDAYCLWMAAAAAPGAAFVATADSVRIAPFGPLPLLVLHRHARRIFARDRATADALAARGLPADSPGNVMMDLARPDEVTLGIEPGVPVVALLPGSRSDAPENAALLARVAAGVARAIPKVRFLMALSPRVPVEEVQARLSRETAVEGTALLLTTRFAEAVGRAAVVVGLAGTANEQAAGLGRPVVAFPGPGAQFGRAFLAAQHRLLGDALVPTSGWPAAADVVVRLLRDPAERARRGAEGQARMGPPGAAARIAAALWEMLAERSATG